MNPHHPSHDHANAVPFARKSWQRSILIALLSLSFSLVGQAQEIKGEVADVADNKMISGTNVLLYKPDDSVMFRGTITDAKGQFVMNNVPSGKYRIAFSHVGYAEQSMPVDLSVPKLSMGKVQLSKASKGMNEVVVVARKPPYEVKADRMVVNVKSSIGAAGLSILDVLERSPGVTVYRQNSSIAMVGKSGVRIMINGKVTNMPPEAIYQMLAGMSSSNIEKLELITTPPSNLDAEGNGGYINIVMAKNPNEGTNGSLTLGVGVRDNPLYNMAADFNHRKGKWNVFGSYSYSHDPYAQTLEIGRNYTYNGTTTDMHTFSARDAHTGNQFGRIGADYQLTPSTIVGFLVSGYDTKWNMNATNTMNKQTGTAPDTMTVTANKEYNHWNNYGLNLNLVQDLKRYGKLSIDLDRVHYHDDNPSSYLNLSFSDKQPIKTWGTRVSKNTPIDMYIAKIDHSLHINPRLDMEMGAKAAYYQFNNNVQVQNTVANDWVTDNALSNTSHLNESVWAGYASLSWNPTDKTSTRLGLRYEHTNTLLENALGEKVVDRSYGNFFPSASISHRINDRNTVSLAYSRRITRPSFNEMAPWVTFFDPYTFFAGNPNLSPAITDNLNFSYALGQMVASLSYSHDDQFISFIHPTVDTATGISVVGAKNLESMKTYAATFSIPIKVTKWWRMQNVLNGQYQEARDVVNKVQKSFSSYNFQFSSTQSMTFKKAFSLEASFNYFSGGLFGTWTVDPYWTANLGFRKVMKKVGTFVFNVNDVFMTNKQRYSMEGSSWNSWWTARFASRSFILTYVANFGSNTVKSKRERNTATDSENRVHK